MLLLAAGLLGTAGCQDGPLYALKHVNPYFTMKEWKADRELGVTDHQRREELVQLTESISEQSIERQRYWVGQLTQIMQQDPSAEMRRLAVAAAGKVRDDVGLALVESGLDDEDLKVRMEACRALGRRADDVAARMLAATAGTDTDQDVRNAAIEALGKVSGQVAVDALRTALRHRDPATRQLAIASLRGATGKDYGDEPEEWIAALDSEPATTNYR